jgi:hypothetical protein
MKTFLISLILIILVTVMLYPGVKDVKLKVNPDKPLKGEWDFKPTKVRAITEAGKDTFSRPEIAVSRDGTLCVWDWKNKLSYIFNSEGEFRKSFGKRGEGPGEMRWHLNSLFIGDKLITVDIDRLHYFTKNGEFIKSVPGQLSRLEPHFFINENEFISAAPFNYPEGTSRITHVNLKTGKKNTIQELRDPTKKQRREGPNFTLVGLSPVIVTAYDYDSHRLYYGVSHSYVIHAVDLKGNVLDSFSVEREKKKISLEAKVRELVLMDPSGPHKEIAKRLPDEIVYFHRIQMVNGLIYVFVGNFGIHWENQQIDIFSPGGKYLYRAQFKPAEGLNIYFSSNCILFQGDYLYVVLEDEDGEVMIVKYKIELPSER